jgi:vacuolar-type H+-ATPase subunit I/STV1
VPKFTNAERIGVKSLVASLTIKRIPDSEIINEVYRQTNKTISRTGLYRIKQQIKRESYQWYESLRKDNSEYIHEFKERINEIVDLQRRHYKIIQDNPNNAGIQQSSLAELHKLNITLSNYFDVAPTILNFNIGQGNKSNTSNKDNGDPVSISQQDKEGIIV